MSAKNPPGYPLTGEVVEDDDGLYVTYRPRIGGRRRRVHVPAEVAEVLRDAQSREVERRQSLAEEAPKRKRKASKRKASKRKVSKRTASKRPASKRTASKRPASKRPASKRRTAARAVSDIAERASDVAADVAKPGQLGLFENPRGAPNLARLGTCAELGRVVELRVEGEDGQTYAHRWKSGRPRLLWSPKQRCLVWVMGADLENRQKGAVRTHGAAKLFENWAARGAVQTGTIAVPAGPLKRLGRAVSILYTSDKWGSRGGTGKQYIHEFSPKVGAYNHRAVFAVRGGRLTVTERGIVY